MRKRILVVEDNEAIGHLILANLELSGYEARHVLSAIEALEIIERENYHLIVLDIMMPKLNGFEFMERIDSKAIPVIMLTAMDNLVDKVKGLKLGADDYITKPFESLELIARIDAVLRRYDNKEDTLLSFKHVTMDLASYEVKINGLSVELTVKEFDLLRFFLENENHVLTREQLLTHVWGYDFDGSSRTLDIHIKRVRAKVELYDFLKTIHRVGYVLKDVSN